MHRPFKPPAIAALLYVATWIVGLSIWPANPSVTSSRREIVTAYAGHRALATAQFMLVEGLAAVVLACVVVARAARERAPGAPGVRRRAGGGRARRLGDRLPRP
jgi:hypothetical protein